MLPRVLDIDLDFFLEDVEHYRSYDAGRLDPEEYPPWKIEDVLEFLREHCGLTGPLPGAVTEHHGQMFEIWREAIEAGLMTAPFHLTHVDAHADLGLGETAHRYLLTELMHAPPELRTRPRRGEGMLTDGSFLAFSAACRWLTELVYVVHMPPHYAPPHYNGPWDGDPGDIHPYLMEGFDPHGENIRLTALTDKQFEEINGPSFERPKIETDEPRIPFRRVAWPAFRADRTFDMIFLARSPAYTPAEADPIFDEIRRRFIDEHSFR